MFRNSVQIWRRRYQNWPETCRLTFPGWVKLSVCWRISTCFWNASHNFKGLLCFIILYSGKPPDAVNFWLGEETAVTSSECLILYLIFSTLIYPDNVNNVCFPLQCIRITMRIYTVWYLDVKSLYYFLPQIDLSYRMVRNQETLLFCLFRFADILSYGCACLCIYVYLFTELYQPATYRQKQNGEFEIVDEDSPKVSFFLSN